MHLKFYAFEIFYALERKEGWRKQGRDWIAGQLKRSCALLRINTPLEGCHFWYFKGMLTYLRKNNGRGWLQTFH